MTRGMRRFSGGEALGQGGQNVQIERLAEGAGLLGAVEHGDARTVAGSAATKCSTEKGRNRRTLSTPTFSPWATRWFDGLLGDIAAGAHEDDDALGIRGADVVEELVLASGDLGEAVHRFCTMVGTRGRRG